MAFLAALLIKPKGPKEPKTQVPSAPPLPEAPPAAAPPSKAIEEQATLGEADVLRQERRRRGQRATLVSNPQTLGLTGTPAVKNLLGG